jgi:photoactive yellow protein
MQTIALPNFDQADLLTALSHCNEDQLDALEFGVIGFDAEGMVRQYNRFESTASGLSPQRVLHADLFSSVAPCMNNFMVAQRFEDAAAAGAPLDDTIDYVLTLRMRPTRVKLRLLAHPDEAMRYVLVQRSI